MARIKLPSPCVCVYFFAERLPVGGDLDFLPGDENLSLSASFFGDFAGVSFCSFSRITMPGRIA